MTLTGVIFIVGWILWGLRGHCDNEPDMEVLVDESHIQGMKLDRFW